MHGRSDGRHLVWHTGSTISPADFCKLAGNTKNNPLQTIMISQTRQTLAEFQVSSRAQARWREPRLITGYHLARAAAASSLSYVPESGSFVTVFILPALDQTVPSSSPTRCARENLSQPQQEHQNEEQAPNEAAANASERVLGGGICEGGQRKSGGVEKGILVSRTTDGWYQVLLVKVPPPLSMCVSSCSFESCDIIKSYCVILM